MSHDARKTVSSSEEPAPTDGYSARDLELMHKYATETYKSLCGDKSDTHAWQVLIPQRAYSHEYLLHAILALAALHIAATASDMQKALIYLETAVQYSSLSFGSYRQALSQLTPETCEAVFACSVIVMVISMALPSLSARYRGEKLIMLETMTIAWELIQGGRRISCISEAWLRSIVFENYNFWEMKASHLDPNTSTALYRLDQLNQESHLERRDSNHEAIELLRSCFARFAYSPHPASILPWLGYVNKTFVNQLCSREPLAMVIFMYWGVLLDELGNWFWWAQGSGKALISELSGELEPWTGDPKWAAAMKWPQRILSS